MSSGEGVVVVRSESEAAVALGPTTAAEPVEAVKPPVIETAAEVRPASGSVSAGLRMTHPANGRFDMVVVQADVADLLPPSAAVMAGQPVYTVYLQVGDSKEWVLHFCAADMTTVQSGSVVKLGDPRPLAPPYPRLTILPSQIPPSEAKVILVHGLIDETGTMRSLRVLGGEGSGERAEHLLAALAQWQFRPARRGADAARVEVLLAVPTTRI